MFRSAVRRPPSLALYFSTTDAVFLFPLVLIRRTLYILSSAWATKAQQAQPAQLVPKLNLKQHKVAARKPIEMQLATRKRHPDLAGPPNVPNHLSKLVNDLISLRKHLKKLFSNGMIHLYPDKTLFYHPYNGANGLDPHFICKSTRRHVCGFRVLFHPLLHNKGFRDALVSHVSKVDGTLQPSEMRVVPS